MEFRIRVYGFSLQSPAFEGYTGPKAYGQWRINMEKNMDNAIVFKPPSLPILDIPQMSYNLKCESSKSGVFPISPKHAVLGFLAFFQKFPPLIPKPFKSLAQIPAPDKSQALKPFETQTPRTPKTCTQSYSDTALSSPSERSLCDPTEP